MNKRKMSFLLLDSPNDAVAIKNALYINNFAKKQEIKILSSEKVKEGQIIEFIGSNQDYDALLEVVLKDTLLTFKDFLNDEDESTPIFILPINLTTFFYEIDADETNRMDWLEILETMKYLQFKLNQKMKIYEYLFHNNSSVEKIDLLKELVFFTKHVDFNLYDIHKDFICQIEGVPNKEYDDVYIYKKFIKLKNNRVNSKKEAIKIAKEIIYFHTQGNPLDKDYHAYINMDLESEGTVMFSLDKLVEKHKLSIEQKRSLKCLIKFGYQKRRLLKIVDKRIERISLDALIELGDYLSEINLSQYVKVHLEKKAKYNMFIDIDSIKTELLNVNIENFTSKEQEKLIDICNKIY